MCRRRRFSGGEPEEGQLQPRRHRFCPLVDFSRPRHGEMGKLRVAGSRDTRARQVPRGVFRTDITLPRHLRLVTSTTELKASIRRIPATATPVVAWAYARSGTPRAGREAPAFPGVRRRRAAPRLQVSSRGGRRVWEAARMYPGVWVAGARLCGYDWGPEKATDTQRTRGHFSGETARFDPSP